MRAYLYLISILLLGLGFSCNKAYGDVSDAIELDMYIIRAMRMWGGESKLPNMPVHFIEYSPDGFSGICHLVNEKPDRIEIVYSDWKELDDVGKTWLVAHEIGHCVFNQKHSMDPANIMFPKTPKTNELKERAIESLLKRGSK